jgi:type I restriction enzyme S subunit
MSDWRQVALGEICSIEIGGTPSRSEPRYWWKSDEDGIRLPWVSISDMKGKVITDTKESITENGALQSNCKHVPKGTLLMSFKLTIGRLAFAGRDLYTNEAISAIKPLKDACPEFLYYGLQYWNLTGDSDQAVKGVTLNKQKLQEIPCLLPPLPEQKKIAEILSGIDRCIQAKRSLINKVESTMRALREDLMTGQEEWQEFELGELLTFRNGLNTEKESFGRGVPFVSYKDVYAGGIVNSKMLKQRVSLSAVEEERFSLQSGDILFTRTSETPEEIGFTCVFDDKYGSAVFNGFCIRGRPLEEGKLMPEFVSFSLRSEYVLTQMRFLCKYTTRAGISAESLSQVRVHIPDLETQKRLTDSLLAVNRYRAAQEEAIKNLKNIKKSVSAALLSGRKRVTP